MAASLNEHKFIPRVPMVFCPRSGIKVWLSNTIHYGRLVAYFTLNPWTLCAFFFFHKMKIIGLPSVEVCIASNALYSTSTLIIKSYFVCRESLRQRKKLKVYY